MELYAAVLRIRVCNILFRSRKLSNVYCSTYIETCWLYCICSHYVVWVTSVYLCYVIFELVLLKKKDSKTNHERCIHISMLIMTGWSSKCYTPFKSISVIYYYNTTVKRLHIPSSIYVEFFQFFIWLSLRINQ